MAEGDLNGSVPASPRPDIPVDHLLSDTLRPLIEQAVSAHLGRPWRATRIAGRGPMASHPAAILSDGAFSVFVKLGEGRRAQDQLEREVAGLRLLTEKAGVLTPLVLASLTIEGGELVIMEAVKVVERQSSHWRQIGQALARLHAVKGPTFGLDEHAYWGDLYQDNTPLPGWPEFFWRRRIAPRLRGAEDSGHLPPDFVARVERLSARLPELCGPAVQPTLLHGDAHQNNFLSTRRGPVLIDPAVYYGHPEIDLAHIDVFSPVPDDIFQGYREAAPLDAGFAGRRDLWRIPFWLAMIEVDGERHVAGLEAALRTYHF